MSCGGGCEVGVMCIAYKMLTQESLGSCTFLVFSRMQYVYYAGGMGNWTTDGCKTEYVNTSNATTIPVECKCNHLTNFAVLVVRAKVK